MMLWLFYLNWLDVIKDASLQVVLNRSESRYQTQADAIARIGTPMPDYETATDNLHGQVGAFMSFLIWYRTLVCWYTIAITLRFFKAFSAQPRLNAVTETLIKAMPGAFHFGVVLAIIFTAYTVAGILLF